MSHHNTPRTIVITGASAGVGRATAKLFAETEGANVALIARGQESLDGARQEVEALGGQVLTISCDVADAEAVEAAAAKVEQTWGTIDVWVNNAMTSVFAFITDTSAAEFKRVTEVCYLGYVHGTQAALRRMLPRNTGHIIQVGSALAYRGIPLQAAYCASKHAIQGFMDSLQAELIHKKSAVIATMVQMPALNTPQFDWCRNKMSAKPQPVPPIYQPEVAAKAIVYASHHSRREIYVGLSTVVAIVGNKLLPGLGDWYLGRNGVASQESPDPAVTESSDNLYSPVAGDPGTHGRFDNLSRRSSPQLWASLHRSQLVATGLCVAFLAGLRWGRR